MAAPELPPPHPGEVERKAMGHVVALELTSAGRRGSETRNTWRHRSSPQQGGEVQGRGTRGSARAHLGREVRFRATRYVVVHGCTSCSLC
jgi:hypothetical protein